MKFVVQRVKKAQVSVENQIIGKIDKGLLVLVGIDNKKDIEKIDRAIIKILAMRLWSSKEKGFEKSVADISGGVLVVSQFTLMADVSKGNRPSFTAAMDAKEAEIIYNKFIEKFKLSYEQVEQGKFQAMMAVELVNDGPVTIVFEL